MKGGLPPFFCLYIYSSHSNLFYFFAKYIAKPYSFSLHLGKKGKIMVFTPMTRDEFLNSIPPNSIWMMDESGKIIEKEKSRASLSSHSTPSLSETRNLNLENTDSISLINQYIKLNNTPEENIAIGLCGLVSSALSSAAFGYVATAVLTATNPVFGAMYSSTSTIVYSLLSYSICSTPESSCCLAFPASVAISYFGMNAMGYAIPFSTVAVLYISPVIAITALACCCLPCISSCTAGAIAMQPENN